jgi:hypothetical protein
VRRSAELIGKQQATKKEFFQLLQLRVLRLGLLQDGDVGVGVFPEREEVHLWLLPVCRPLVQNCHLIRSFATKYIAWRQADVVELFRRSYGLGITACASLEYALSIPLPSTAVVT